MKLKQTIQRILQSPLLSVLLLFSGIGAGYMVAQNFPINQKNSVVGMNREGGYEFVNPLLSCDISEDVEYPNYASFQKKLQAEANTLIAQGDVTRISIYFRNMDYGYWTGVRADDTFVPASLMKVPLLIAGLKESQGKSAFMLKQLAIQGPDLNAEESIRPATTAIHIGHTYAVRDLLNAMITQSDNNASVVLQKTIPEATIADVFQQFGVPSESDINADVVSPKDYMRFFRILYNASYLWRGNSQRALMTLSQTEFKDGLVAGMPAGLTVAHKFGERTINIVDAKTQAITGKKLELHDCGIVYYPQHPYGICVMTEGPDFTRMKHAIAEVSKITYDVVDQGLLK